MTGITNRFLKRTLWTWLILALITVASAPRTEVWAAFGEDLEKPKPEFTRKDDVITATLIPRE